MHTVLNHKFQLPDFIAITQAKVNDAKGVLQIPIVENGIYVVDRAYLYLKWLYSIVPCQQLSFCRKSNPIHIRNAAVDVQVSDISSELARIFCFLVAAISQLGKLVLE